MSHTRFQATVDVSLIADIADHAALYHSGDFDRSCEKILSVGLKFMYFSDFDLLEEVGQFATFHHMTNGQALSYLVTFALNNAPSPEDELETVVLGVFDQAGEPAAPEPAPAFSPLDPFPI